MIYIVAILEIKNDEAFEDFETQAIQILRSHDGELVAAFNPDSLDTAAKSGIEVHYIQFPAIENYNSYRADPALQALSDIRSNAIHRTQLYISDHLKDYA